MIVSMMSVRIMCVAVHDRLVMVPMRVRTRIGHRWIVRSMRMLMVLVVDVRVCVIHRHVCVNVLMHFRHMQPYSQRHQRASNEQANRDRIAPDD